MLTLQAKTEQHPSGVPDAPFKTTWPELAMKRIIREAAEKGYDKVAWTPGEVQAARYDLSKHVDEIHYYPETNYLTYKHKGGGWGETMDVSPNKLADHIGKDAAEKIMSTRPEQSQRHGSTATGPYHTLSGIDLKIGGEGMKGFYDEILPATVNKLVKKHGGRVTQGDVPIADAKGTPYTLEGNGPWVIRDRRREFVADFNNREKAELALAELHKTKTQGVHTLDITPSLRAAAMKGFPLFSAGGVAATGAMGELARQDEYQ